jgi:uncharacterized protein
MGGAVVMLLTTLARDAARARRDGVRAAADRPSQRRAGEDPAPRAFVRAAAAVQVRAAVEDGGLTFEGMASVTGRAYEMWDAFGPYEEVVKVGAFEETLAQPGLDVPLVIGHDQIRRMARTTNGTLTLSEVTQDAETGLHVLADLDPTDADVAYIVPKMRAGLIDEMSFAFRIDSGRWSEDFSTYAIAQADLSRGDVAIVGWGANPHTSGSVRTKNSQAERLRLARLGMARASL